MDDNKRVSVNIKLSGKIARFWSNFADKINKGFVKLLPQRFMLNHMMMLYENTVYKVTTNKG